MKEYIRLGDVISKASVERCGNREYPVLSITMKDGLVFQDEKFKKRIASVDTAEYKVIPRGKLVQGIHIDEANFGIQDITDTGIVSPAYKVWDVRSDIIYPKYLEIIMRSPRSIAFYKSKLNGSVNRRGRMTDNDFLGMTIPFDKYDRQKEIVSIIGKVKLLLGQREQELQKLDELIKARFVEMFGDPISNAKGWNTAPLTDACIRIFGGGTPSKSHPEYFEGLIPWVSPKDMKSDVITDSIDHITEEAIENSTTNLVPEGSVLMVIRSGILKHSLPVAINTIPVTINQDMKAFVPGENVTASFLRNYFKAIEQDVLSGVRGVTADNIDFKSFQQRKIILPPIEQQRDYEDFCMQVDKSKFMVSCSERNVFDISYSCF